jgi:type III secretion protein N (ATPase)
MVELLKDAPAAVRAPAAASGEALSSAVRNALQGLITVKPCGRVVEARGTLLQVAGIDARIGDLCELHLGDGTVHLAEVTGLAREGAMLMPHGDLEGLSLGARVVALNRGYTVGVGDSLLGRVLNGFGDPIDNLGPLLNTRSVPVHGSAPNALSRRPVRNVFSTGVRAIDSLLTLGEGQRVGVFAPAGVGKSTLAAMVVRAAEVDVCVVALIGERGREVGEFVNDTLGAEGMRRSVVVAATSDSSASERVNAGSVATAIAESFRDRGMRVLLVMDSVTRLARALREIGLATGEPPTRRGFPPSVFALLPRLLERAGNGAVGSITALYTVLMEGEDDADPIAEEVRSILDGHIVLTRAIAQTPLYPAIDMLDSLSRLMPAICSPEHLAAAQRVRALLARHKEIELLLQVGEYRAGNDALADEAIAKRPRILEFLGQKTSAPAAARDSVRRLLALAA